MQVQNWNNSIWYVIDNENRILKKFENKNFAYDFYYSNVSYFYNQGKILYVISEKNYFDFIKSQNSYRLRQDFLNNQNHNTNNNYKSINFDYNLVQNFKNELIWEIKNEVNKAIKNELYSLPYKSSEYYKNLPKEDDNTEFTRKEALQDVSEITLQQSQLQREIIKNNDVNIEQNKPLRNVQNIEQNAVQAKQNSIDLAKKESINSDMFTKFIENLEK